MLSGPNELGLLLGRSLHLTFRGEGWGLPAQDVPMVFEPYFTTKPRTKPRGSHWATCLRLAMAQVHVQAHWGAIWAESVLGQGATFHPHLPLASPE